MELVESIVNERTAERRNAARNKRIKKHLRAVCIAVIVAVAFLLFALAGLVHPVLATVIMVVSLMIGCYHLGRCVRFGKRVR